MQLHASNVYTGGQHIAHPGDRQNPCRQAGRQVLLLAGQLHNKRFRSTNESPVEETEVLFRPCKKAICKQVHNNTPWFTHEPLPHPKILLFLFFLPLFSSFFCTNCALGPLSGFTRSTSDLLFYCYSCGSHQETWQNQKTWEQGSEGLQNAVLVSKPSPASPHPCFSFFVIQVRSKLSKEEA